LILSLLKELEQRPGQQWSRVELDSRCVGVFEHNSARTFTRRVQRGVDNKAWEVDGRLVSLVDGGDRFEAYDPDDPEWEPQTLQFEDGDLFEVDIDELCRRLRERHGLVGETERLSDRLVFVGEVTSSIAVVLGLFQNRGQALQAAAALPAMLGSRFSGRILVTPSSWFGPSDERSLEARNTVVSHLLDDTWAMAPSIHACAVRVADDVSIGGFDLDSGFRYSADFRSCQHRGARYSLPTLPAAAVGLLYEARVNGTPDLSDEWVLERIGSKQQSLRSVFEDTAAWGSLVIEGESRGTHRLNLD
jgi:hypothetical protein